MWGMFLGHSYRLDLTQQELGVTQWKANRRLPARKERIFSSTYWNWNLLLSNVLKSKTCEQLKKNELAFDEDRLAHTDNNKYLLGAWGVQQDMQNPHLAAGRKHQSWMSHTFAAKLGIVAWPKWWSVPQNTRLPPAKQAGTLKGVKNIGCRTPALQLITKGFKACNVLRSPLFLNMPGPSLAQKGFLELCLLDTYHMDLEWQTANQHQRHCRP